MSRPPAILIVEDDARVRTLLAHRLASRYTNPVIEAETGEDALERLQEAVVALVLIDPGLPGIDGLEVVRRIRALTPPTNQVPILMVSAYPESQYAAQALAAGCDAYYQKPLLDVELFYEAVTKFLAKNFTDALGKRVSVGSMRR